MSDRAQHTVTIEFDRHGGPTLTFKCHATEDADCRTMCPESECEEGCYYPDRHQRVPIGYCNVVEWMDNTDEVETCIASPTTSITAPVEIVWGGTWDGPDWRFVEQVTRSCDKHPHWSGMSDNCLFCKREAGEER